MTEDEWLACDEPRRMLDFLRTNGKASQRKCRLLMCNLSRSLWSDLSDGRSRLAVEAAERFADGSGDLAALRVAAADAELAHRGGPRGVPRGPAGGRGQVPPARQGGTSEGGRLRGRRLVRRRRPARLLGLGLPMMEGDPLEFYDGIEAVDCLMGVHAALVPETFGNPFSAPNSTRPGSPGPTAWSSPGRGRLR